MSPPLPDADPNGSCKKEWFADEADAGMADDSLPRLPLGELPTSLRSPGKRGRDPLCSKYRMAWVMVFFDLPVGTPEERKAAANFRKDLVRDGYIMVQFSVYARPCGTAERAATHVRRLRSKIPEKGEVRGLLISDAQWGRMIVVRGQTRAAPEQMPQQMLFF